VDELRAQLDGMLQGRRVNRVNPSAYPVASFEDEDLAAGGGKPLRSRESRDPGPQDDDVVGRPAGCRAIRSGVP